MATVSEKGNDQLEVRFNDGLIIVLKRPNRAQLMQALSATMRDPLGGADVILKNNLVEGDKAKLTNNTGYLHQINTIIDQIFGQVFCLLDWKQVEDKDQAVIEFVDGLSCTLRPLTRSEYSTIQIQSRTSPIRGVEDTLRVAWINGSEEIKTSAGHLLGLTSVLNEFSAYTGGILGN